MKRNLEKKVNSEAEISANHMWTGIFNAMWKTAYSAPFNRFILGNKETLKDIPAKEDLQVREQMRKFHKKYYSADIMTLCLIGKESMKELKQLALSKFSKIPNNNARPMVLF